MSDGEKGCWASTYCKGPANCPTIGLNKRRSKGGQESSGYRELCAEVIAHILNQDSHYFKRRR